MTTAPTAIDLSRLPAPDAIEALNYETLFSDFQTRFLSAWADARLIDPSLPDYDVDGLETDPIMIVGQAWSYLRLLDRARVNDVYRSLLAQYATSADLDAIAATRNLTRLTVLPATATSAAVLEGDEALLKRFLMSFDRASAGSADRFLYEAYTAWPQSADKTAGLWDARVNGWAVHGRRGDTDIVITGPSGATPTDGERDTIAAAVTADHVKPEAASVEVIKAERVEYSVDLTIEVPSVGPAPDLLRQEAEARVTAAATDRILIGGEIPSGLLAGAAYGPNIITVTDNAPVSVSPDPYKVPVMTGLTITVEVRT
jgi:phage-related baseplate assembly protein